MTPILSPSPNTSTDPFAEAAHLAEQRWDAELELLGLIAPAPRYRWPLLLRLGATFEDFTADDSYVIASALEVGSYHGRDICAKLTCNLLIEAGQWSEDEMRPFVVTAHWGPGPLGALFSRSLYLAPDETPAISAAIEKVHALPGIGRAA